MLILLNHRTVTFNEKTVIYWTGDKRQKNRAEMRTGSLHGIVRCGACVYQTLEAKFLHPVAVNEPYLIE